MKAEAVDLARARFDRLFRAYRLQVFAYCARRTPRSEAQDACSETFLVVWRRLDALPPDDQVLPYLYAVAARVLANQRRSLARGAKLATKLQNIGIGPPVDSVLVVLRREQDRTVEAAVRRLPPKDREIVMLHDWEELTCAQIAEVVGLSTAAVDQRLHRAYRRLGRQLEWLLDGAGPASLPPAAETGSNS